MLSKTLTKKVKSFPVRCIMILTVMTSTFVAVTSCYTAIDKGGDNMQNTISEITEQSTPLSAFTTGDYSPEVIEYFKYYNLCPEQDITGLEHRFGTFESNSQTLSAHLFVPEQYSATVLIVHGYMNHTGQLCNLIEYLLNKGYAVAAFDLPGHGLSSGRRAVIEDFSQYTASLNDFTSVCKQQLDGPYHIIGFSNGAAVVIDKLLTDNNESFDKVILAAPLIRCSAWNASKLGLKISNRFTDTIPRVNRKNSSDNDFCYFTAKKDYLHTNCVSAKWLKALYHWNESLLQYPPIERNVLVIQGKKDNVVDWKYNLNIINEKFTDSQVVMVDRARHELFNESPQMRDKVFKCIAQYLEIDS